MPRTGSFLGAALLHRQELRSRLVLTHHHPDHAVNVA
jgi:glyoxylase-like metal-dependent hydrolase (beta-lactamase superfamily II)